VVRAGGSDRLPSESASSTVSHADLERRQPRSAPDALRYEPGVFVQQTAHGQGSAFIRGLTGQQTLLLFDGIRLNNSTFRQGPNQYFFTVDSRTIEAVEIVRGGSSTRFGSDALGGTIQALPIEPLLPEAGRDHRLSPSFITRATTADSETGGRAELHAALRTRGGLSLAFFGGVGGRDVGLLQSGGRVENPNPNTPIGLYPQVPRYASDGRTQLGTGFRELTADGRLVLGLSPNHRLTLASYHYLQFDAPRTDQCAPPTAPPGVCLTYEQQFRHLTYVAWDAQNLGRIERLRITISYQQQHESRRYDDPSVLLRVTGYDDVHTVGLTAAARSAVWALARGVGLQLHYGGDLYFDWLRSTASRTYTDNGSTQALSRGQYIDGSYYLYGGSYIDGELRLPRRFVLRAGGRLSYVRARADEDPLSGTRAFDLEWAPVVGRAGIEWRPFAVLTLRANVDHSFRAPNLNDLTARQQTGPGFQFENADLKPERATTFELGALLSHRYVSAELWAFQTLLGDAVLKVSKLPSDCPPETPQCQGSWTRFQLQNAPELSLLRGIESSLRLRLPWRMSLRSTLTYTWGEGPRVGDLAKGVFGVVVGERVPLSRIPPLNGTVELVAPHPIGELSAALRWAAPQDRLAIADYSDGRIPKYGTPGFVVLDLRASARIENDLSVGVVLENVFDSPYRYHGSSINGPGRGVIFTARVLR
jgi:iron complex outermembrane receptor protein/hemoglobin/transferrin/lactoferrin receptor protein